MSSFNPTLFYQTLEIPRDAPFSIQMQVHDELPSTNDHAQQLMAQGAAAGTTVLALRQSRGRGSRGKQWRSPLGGLYLSLGLRPNLPASEGHRLTLGSAWGLATVLNQTLALQASKAIQVKWPNDLVLQGKKLGGILTESRLRNGQIYQAVIGIGINWQNSVIPSGIHLDSIRSGERNRGILSLEALAAFSLKGLVLGYSQWCQDVHDMSDLVEKYESQLAGLGKAVMISPEKMGKIEGITPSGELKVSVNSGTLVFSPGTINLGYD